MQTDCRKETGNLLKVVLTEQEGKEIPLPWGREEKYGETREVRSSFVLVSSSGTALMQGEIPVKD